jgi:FkbM family methyltransferase
VTGGELIVNVQGGARLCVPADVRQYTPYILLEQEDWFEDEIRFVRRWLREGMHTIDAGASYGVYTLAMGKAVGASGRVWAFEPTAGVAEHLEHSLAVNGLANVALRRAAVSDRAGSIEFSSGPAPELNAVGKGHQAGTTARVEAVTLDQLAVDSVDFLKLDVEGHEREVLDGAQRLLREASPLVMMEIRALAIPDMSPLRRLLGMGYRAYRLLPGPLLLAPMDLDEPVSEYQLNAFACKDDRAAQLAAAGFLANQPAPPPMGALARGAAYRAGLAYHALSCDTGRSANERVGGLYEALRLLGEGVQARDTLGRRLSYARVAADALRRNDAIEALRNAILRIDNEGESVHSEPLLAPSLRAERPDVRRGAPLKCVALEAYEKLRTFSSCFHPEPVIVNTLVSLPGHSPEMERRRQLIRMRRGLQTGPKQAPELEPQSEENLNGDFWRSGRHVA